MKIKKKTAMLASFALGTLLFATTALADIVTKSGYDQLKDAFKVTAENFSDKLNSFTLDVSFVVKDNGKTLQFNNEIQKYDRGQSARESISNRESINGDKYSSYYYVDTKSTIRYSEHEQTYYVTEFAQERKVEGLFTNPFKENRAEDLEKIADALVGSLKDHVVVTENPDGSKLLSGSLTEVQIPPLVNAVASFQSKGMFNGNHQSDQMPHLIQDIFVKEVNGSALLNKDGIMESILGTVVITGKDEQGQVHNLSIEVLGKLLGINSTTVAKPDLTGEKIVKEKQETTYGSEITNPQKFVGKFKNDILIEKDGKYVKIGERIIDIAHIDKEAVAGRYHEEYKQGFEEYAANKRDFSFDARCNRDRDPRNAEFDYANESGVKTRGNIYFDERLGKLFFNLDNRDTLGFDSTFSPAFE
ncbi:MAG: hypothetical protein ACYDEJ_05040 [Desulfitobacteriaceae bacterium]